MTTPSPTRLFFPTPISSLRGQLAERPGYFGRRKFERIAELNQKFGERWTLLWVFGGTAFDFFNACRALYESSYLSWLRANPADLDYICAFRECYDNDPSNVRSGLDYMIQEAYSTHIQDIAVRNVLRQLGRWFDPNASTLLRIRGADSNGHKFGPGNIPFAAASEIGSPSLCPSWAQRGSVEDLWQSNKFVYVLGEGETLK